LEITAIGAELCGMVRSTGGTDRKTLEKKVNNKKRQPLNICTCFNGVYRIIPWEIGSFDSSEKKKRPVESCILVNATGKAHR